ncbi:sulfite exporter TauE/SafE family protein [Schauerella aestuarii]|uniref:sulfite exporter TauE/SafE family protein n=1 Tax=Schauerella aestuarii TaxID=2511204 RepID=UPI001367F872|nr:sulfite exporter TauE/SafE family protein [Achromobacter aestuarii]MYZ43430.1 sulfite exporter TauE/SafE family protein [Achromobacter aestuarii]
MTLFIVLGCLASGALIGFLGGLLGIGGGLIAIPALALILGMPQQLAQGTSLILVLPTILLAVRKYSQHSQIDWGVAAAGALSAIAFTWVGARLALGIDSSVLRRSFAVFLFFIAAFYVWQTWQIGRRAKRAAARHSDVTPSEAATLTFAQETQRAADAAAAVASVAAPAAVAPRLTRSRGAVLGVVAGTIGGFFGVGGAILAVPILTVGFKLSQINAQALALSMIIPGSAIALGTYTWAGQANWTVGVPLAVGSLLFVPSGVKLARRLPERRLRGCFAVMLFATVALLVFEG